MNVLKSLTPLSVVLLAGCVTNSRIESFTSQQRARLISMQVISSKPTRPYKQMSTVKGISCYRNAYQNSTLIEDEAIESVKLNAAKINADAVMNLYCQTNNEIDWSNNCWKSIVCVGDAISFTK